MSISSFLWDYYSKMISQDTLRPLILYLYCITMTLKKYLCLFNKQKQKFCDSLENVLMPIGNYMVTSTRIRGPQEFKFPGIGSNSIFSAHILA